jgi:hypothetical protein
MYLEPTQPPLYWVSGGWGGVDLYMEVSSWNMKLIIHLEVVERLRMNRTV